MSYTNKQIEQIENELIPIDAEVEYEEYLEDIYGDIEVCAYTFSQASILKEMDPIAFNEGVKNFIDSLLTDGTVEEVNDEYYWVSDIEGLNFDKEDHNDEN